MKLVCDKDNQLCYTSVVVPCRMGMRMRTAIHMMKFAKRFKSKITLHKGNVSTDVSSILGLLMLGASWNSKIRIKVEGSDASKAAQELQMYLTAQDHCLDH